MRSRFICIARIFSNRSRIRNQSGGLISLRRRFTLFGMRLVCIDAHLFRKPFHTFRDALFSQPFTASTDSGWRGFRSETA